MVFEGVGTAIITPFKDNYTVDFDELGKIVEYQIESGVDSIVVCGTTGEASTMPDAEHLSVVKYVIDKVGGRIPVIAGVGRNHTSHAIELSKKAEEYGADALLHVTPYYNKTSQKGLIAHFTAIAEAVKLPIILYNVTSRTGMTIAPETYKELSKIPNIVATKEASGNMTAIATAMSLCGEDLEFYSGNDDQIVPIMALGARGVISVLSNVKPKETAEMAHSALEGDFKRAARLQVEMMPLINALFCDVNPIPVKEAMNILGFNAGKCRLPLCELDEAKKELLKGLL
ncbi:MAG: 4-hydroxy-tetrahydrodipicolinate synthase [Ruminococcaceae bacterium]|nr:4-hydroxy-tetrahydrodipicolinate synthase [Oscillospiraceae bacterium]